MAMLRPRLLPPPAPTPAQALIDRAFAPGALPSGVPRALWHRVLRAPVEEILARPGKGFRGRLTSIAYQLAGGAGDPPAALAAILETLHAGSMIVDDIEDGSRERRGAPSVHCLYGVPLALNAGNWMYFWPLELVVTLGLPPARELLARQRLNRVLLDCHFGQALDLGARLDDVDPAHLRDVAQAVSTLKTGRLMALAAELGALCAGAGDELREALAVFGEALGVALQMLDDLGNLSSRGPADKRYEDLRLARVTWVWAWASQRLTLTAFSALLQRWKDACGDEVRLSALAAELRVQVGPHGRSEIHRHLGHALSHLRARLPAHPALERLEGELLRLEQSYG